MTKLFLSTIAIFSIVISLILISDTAIWFYNGSSLFDVLGWASGGILEHISNLILGIWLIVSSCILLQSGYSTEKQWMIYVFIVLVGMQMIVKQIYHFFDGIADTYLNPIDIFFGIFMISISLRFLLVKTDIT